MSSPGKNYEITYKVLVVGEMSVGKTSLIRRYSCPEKKMAMSYLTTVGNYKAPYFTVNTKLWLTNSTIEKRCQTAMVTIIAYAYMRARDQEFNNWLYIMVGRVNKWKMNFFCVFC